MGEQNDKKSLIIPFIITVVNICREEKHLVVGMVMVHENIDGEDECDDGGDDAGDDVNVQSMAETGRSENYGVSGDYNVVVVVVVVAVVVVVVRDVHATDGSETLVLAHDADDEKYGDEDDCAWMRIFADDADSSD